MIISITYTVQDLHTIMAGAGAVMLAMLISIGSTALDARLGYTGKGIRQNRG